MKQIEEPSRVMPVLLEADVLAVGSGSGGISAALGAAREVVDAMLLEQFCQETASISSNFLEGKGRK